MNCQLSPTAHRSIHSNSLLKLKTNNLFNKNSPFTNTNIIPATTLTNKALNLKKTINSTSIKKLEFNGDIKNKKITNNSIENTKNINYNNNCLDNNLLGNENENMKKSKTINFNNIKSNNNNKEMSNGSSNNNLKIKLDNLQKLRNNKNLTKSRNNFIKIQESISLTTLDKINKLRKGRIDQTNSIHNTIHNTNNVIGLSSKDINQANYLVNNTKDNKQTQNSPNSFINQQQQIGLNANNNPVEKSNFQKYIKIVIEVFLIISIHSIIKKKSLFSYFIYYVIK